MKPFPFPKVPAVRFPCIGSSASKLHGLCALTFCVVTAGHAADVNTTGGTTVLNTDIPGNRYLGNGILQISADANSLIELGFAFNTPVTEFAMTSGGLISIDSGVTLRNGGFARGVWTNNFADLTINGTGSLDIWDGQPVRVDALSGTGAIVLGIGNANKELRVGVDNGSGTFSGNIAQSNGGSVLRIFKEGSGTQTFNGNLTAQIPRQYIINGGAIDLSSADAHTMTSQFLGSGTLTKSGAGALTISSASGALMVSGTTNVTGGSLGFGSEVSARANLVAATGTTLGLNFTGQATVGTLNLGGSGPLAAGIYDSTHVTYGSYFTGTGQLNVLDGAVPTGSGTWSSSTGGFWNVASRWTSAAIANGSGNTATIGVASAITVTLDRNETLGHLVFQGNNHTLNGDSSTLTLAGTVPSVTVAGGTSSLINATIAGTSGLAKEGAGTLTLASGTKSYTGGTAVNGGRLVFADLLAGNQNYSVVSGATLELNSTGTFNRQLSGGTISGSGNLVKSGNGRILLGASGARQNIALESGALIDVQGGVLRGEFSNNSGGINGWLNNKADLNVATGAFFDIWDSNGIVDSISGSGTVNKGWSANSSLTFGVDNGSATFSGTLSQGAQSYGGQNGGTFSLIKSGTGTQTFSGSISPTGTVSINGGTLEISGATGSLTTTSGVTINGGTLLLSGSAPDRIVNTAPFALGGGLTTSPESKLALGSGAVTESFGALSLTAGTSFRVIDFGTPGAEGRLTFASLSGGAATTLSIWNWSGSISGGGADQLSFTSGVASGGLLLDNVSFYSDGGTTLFSGSPGATFVRTELVPVPEPGALLSTLILFLGSLFRRRR